MTIFIGSTAARLDAKGRVFIPAAFRRSLPLNGDGKQVVVINKDLTRKCLVFYSEDVFGKAAGELEARTNRWNSEENENLERFVGRADYLEIDAQGRTLIQKKFLKEIEAEGDVVFVGQYDRFVMMSKETHESFVRKVSDEELARILSEKMAKN